MIQSRATTRRGFTLVELLVVVAIISILLGLSIPAVQSVRARFSSAACRNNMRQIGIALGSYYATNQTLPPSLKTPDVRGSWSVHGRILPFLELSSAHRLIDLDADWHTQDRAVTALAVPVYNCPSEPFSQTRTDAMGLPYVHGTNYGFNMGTWFIYDPVTDQRGDGAFVVKQGRRYTDVADGVSNTLAASDVRAYTSYIRNVDVIDPTLPTSPDHFLGVTGELKLGPSIDQNTGHTVWCDGRVHHTGFTTVFRPNTVVNYISGSKTCNIDYTSQQEGLAARPTYAAVTARSHHAGGVNALNLDGSVRFVSDSISRELWQALGSVDGGETVAETY